MVDPSLATVEAAALTQGVAFLYAQAGELLKRRRDARERATQAGERTDAGSLPALTLPGTAFEVAGTAPAAAVPGVVDELAESLLQARRDVDDYVVGIAALDASSPAVFEAVDRLRRILEEVYGVTVTFRGERRSANLEVTRVKADRIGVFLSANAKVKGDIAGRDIIKGA